MPRIVFPSVEEALALHEILMDRFGGTKGVRDLGLVSSAIHRPQSGYYKDIFEQAAALMESFLLNHCFLDGNKRMAFAMTDVFLRLNGYLVKVSVKQAETFLIREVIQKKVGMAIIAKWVRQHAVKM